MFIVFLLLSLIITADSLVGVPLQVPSQIFYENHVKVDRHPGFAPLIGHTDFRRIADFAIDQSTEWFDPDLVKKGDILFVGAWLLEWFEKHAHEHIKYPYILVTSDVGDKIPCLRSLLTLLYDPKCAAWFCRGMLFSSHPKLCQLPFGQDLAYQNVQMDPTIINELHDAINKKPFIKKHLLYMNHYPRAHGNRDKVVRLFEGKSYCFSKNHTSTRYTPIPRPEYYDDLSMSQFVISPTGLETDCIRTWEAVLLDCFPIVEHTFNDELYEDLPVVIVNKWEDINEQFLMSKIDQLKQCKKDKAYFDYWFQLIKNAQQKVRANENAFSQLEASKFEDQDFADLVSILESRKYKNELLYIGHLTTTRSLQLARDVPFIKRIYLYDCWLLAPAHANEKTFDIFKSHLNDHSLLNEQEKIQVTGSKNHFDTVIINAYRGRTIFLDLTYYRSGLDLDTGLFQYTLKEDIYNLYTRLQPGSLLCGNKSNNKHIKEVLEQLSIEHDLSIQTKGNFWFVEVAKNFH